MQGKFDYSQYLNQIIEHGNKSKSKFVRLEMIMSIYFPELAPAYKEVTKMRGIINAISIKHKRAYEQGDFDGERFLKPFNSNQVKLEQYGDKFKEEIAQCARNA